MNLKSLHCQTDPFRGRKAVGDDVHEEPAFLGALLVHVVAQLTTQTAINFIPVVTKKIDVIRFGLKPIDGAHAHGHRWALLGHIPQLWA